MKISYDPSKRKKTLEERQLDFEQAPLIFAGLVHTFEDDRFDYSERRWITFGLLHGRLVTLVWTPRGECCHIISLRKCNEREKKKYQGRLA
jgi:uncharacterized DUF497 family protein